MHKLQSTLFKTREGRVAGWVTEHSLSDTKLEELQVKPQIAKTPRNRKLL